MPTETDQHARPLTALYIGVVTANADPKRLGRVKVRVPGLLEPESGWAMPLGAPGGGAKRRGWYDPPDLGAEVGVLFNQGDPDVPYYLPAQWGEPDGVIETPGPVGGYATPNHDLSPGTPEGITAEEAPLVKAYETANWLLQFDDRPGKEAFRVEYKKTGDHVAIDGAKLRLEIRATTLLRLVCDGILEIVGNQVNINKRPVLPNGKPI